MHHNPTVISQICKTPRRCTQVIWSDKIRKVTGVNWMTKALGMKKRKNSGGHIHLEAD